MLLCISDQQELSSGKGKVKNPCRLTGALLPKEFGTVLAKVMPAMGRVGLTQITFPAPSQ